MSAPPAERNRVSRRAKGDAAVGGANGPSPRRRIRARAGSSLCPRRCETPIRAFAGLSRVVACETLTPAKRIAAVTGTRLNWS